MVSGKSHVSIICPSFAAFLRYVSLARVSLQTTFRCPATTPPRTHIISLSDLLRATFCHSQPLRTIVLHRPLDSTRCPLALTLISTSTASSRGDMCWFTLTPVKNKKRKRESADSSCAEDLVRVHHKSKPRFSDLKVKAPSSVTVDFEHQHYHHPQFHPLLHHHRHRHPLHPLHLHPIHGPHQLHHLHAIPAIELRGPGRKRCAPPAPPPPSRDSSKCRPRPRAPSPAPCPPREPNYQTRIVEPATVRETTRVALRNVQSGRQQNRLRRVAGYEVLGREMPWQWDCVSSTTGSSVAGGGRWAKRSGRARLPYPPFSTIETWS